MWGRKKDYEVVMKTVKDGIVNRDELLQTASKLYKTVELLNQ